jgi:phosphoribosylformimino-5-aminoimidazole carboxamide ribotide isomerase
LILLPAIDIIDGRCVRLIEGDYGRQTSYGLTPAEAARSFAEEGAEWIHIVDLDGAKAGHPVNREALAEVRRTVDVQLEVGGGVRTLEDAKALLDLGIDRVVAGTRITQDPELARQFFDVLGERFAAGLDLRDGRVATHAWLETSDLDGLSFALELQSLGCLRVIVTDIATDGTLLGPNTPLMRSFVQGLDIPVLASGGVSELADLTALEEAGVEGAIVGKAIYEGRMTVTQALGALREKSHTGCGGS